MKYLITTDLTRIHDLSEFAMDSGRALRIFWGTHVPGATNRRTQPIGHALILMGDWCVSD
jgi:hypothetical protein